MGERWIAHVDMDAFYAAIEIRDDPSLRGKPVVVGGSSAHRGVVSAASYEARKHGIHSAMPMARAQRLCPKLVRIPVNMSKYSHESDMIMTIFRQFSPLIEQLSLDEAFLDLTGTEGILGPPLDAGRKIKEAVSDATRLTASVGIAPVKFVAKIASDLEKPDGLVVVGQGEVEAFLSPLPLSRLWGVGPKSLSVLRGLGLETVGDLSRYPREELARRFGASGSHLHDLACGRDERSVVPEWEAKSYSHEETFASDQSDATFLKAVLLDQAGRVARRLRRAGVAGRVVAVKIRWGDFRTITRQRKMPAPTVLGERIYEEAGDLFDRAWDGRPIRLLGVGVSGIEPPEEEGMLFPPQRPDARKLKLEETIDRLSEKFGAKKIVRAPTLRLGEE
ncbi:MAG: DNA polymerase IV [Candidatus Eisenbacteria bacterium]|nr:DNA polymerase IV [Candidatus Eisenbacteria bacterium]